MGSTIDDSVCRARRIRPPVWPALPLATAPSRCTGSHVRYRFARLSHRSDVSLHPIWFRNSRPLCRFSLFTHCLRVDHFHYAFLANAESQLESNLAHHLRNSSGAPGGSNLRIWSSSLRSTRFLYGCS